MEEKIQKQISRSDDVKLNKCFLDLTLYSAVGFLAGSAFSLLFKNKPPIIAIGAGIGFGFALEKNFSSWAKNKIKSFLSPNLLLPPK